jgi:hypothetical protein
MTTDNEASWYQPNGTLNPGVDKKKTEVARAAACEQAYDVATGAPIDFPEAKDRFKSHLTPGADLRCGCNGSHAHNSPPPKLEGLDSLEVLKRILATKEWRGSTVENDVRREAQVFVAKFYRGKKIGYKKELMMCDVFVVRHPGGAELTLRANLGLPEVEEKEEVAVTYLHGQKPAMAEAMKEARKDLAEMKADAATGRVARLPRCTVGLGGNVKGQVDGQENVRQKPTAPAAPPSLEDLEEDEVFS